MSIQYTTNLAGKPIVKFGCPKCSVRMTARLTEAGNKETCSECGAIFKVPGEERLQAYKNAEEAKKAEKFAQKEQEKQRAAAEEKRRLEAKSQALYLEQQRAEADKQARILREQKRSEALKDSTLDLQSHDWSSGAPYVYDFVETAAVTGNANWLGEFSNLINQRAAQGWEYFRCEDFTYIQPAGCLLFGAAATPVSIKVVVFRKPADFRRKELETDHL